MRSSDHAMSPGAQLAAYREERGWTIEQVAGQLNLAPRQIVALESDDYPALPGMSIVRGFIRAYAKLLKVDAAPLLSMVGGETVMATQSIAPRQTLSTPFSETRLPSMTQRSGASSKWIVGILVVLLAGVAVWVAQSQGQLFPAPKATSSLVTESAPAPLEDAGVERTIPLVSEQSVADTPAPEASSPASDQTEIAAQQTSVSPDTVETEATSVSPTPPEAIVNPPVEKKQASDGGNVLRVEMREESWLEVRRANNDSVVVSRLASAGDIETIEITEPVSVVIGNAAGVDVTLRGKPVELASSTRTNVARLNLK